MVEVATERLDVGADLLDLLHEEATAGGELRGPGPHDGGGIGEVGEQVPAEHEVGGGTGERVGDDVASSEGQTDHVGLIGLGADDEPGGSLDADGLPSAGDRRHEP